MLSVCAGVLLLDPSCTGGQASALTELSVEAWALALRLTEDEDDGVRRRVTAALGAAVAAADGVAGAKQARSTTHGNRGLCKPYLSLGGGSSTTHRPITYMTCFPACSLTLGLPILPSHALRP